MVGQTATYPSSGAASFNFQPEGRSYAIESQDYRVFIGPEQRSLGKVRVLSDSQYVSVWLVSLYDGAGNYVDVKVKPTKFVGRDSAANALLLISQVMGLLSGSKAITEDFFSKLKG